MSLSYIDRIGRWGKGNIDLNNRIVVYNIDGTFSTERSFSTNIDGKEVLLPTIIDGIIKTEDVAIRHYYATGQFLGKFNTVEEADAYAQELHERQEWYYGQKLKQRFFFEIDGTDITKLIKQKGLKWTRNDIDSANAGRSLDGKMHRGRVVTKIKLEITCVPLTQAQASMMLRLIYPEYVNVHYVDPLLGERRVQFYSNNVPSTFNSQATDGSLLWDDLSFPLVER